MAEIQLFGDAGLMTDTSNKISRQREWDDDTIRELEWDFAIARAVVTALHRRHDETSVPLVLKEHQSAIPSKRSGAVMLLTSSGDRTRTSFRKSD
ncbi:MAG: hypothetical protein AAF678_12350 [Pseudomonadota bacterium]